MFLQCSTPGDSHSSQGVYLTNSLSFSPVTFHEHNYTCPPYTPTDSGVPSLIYDASSPREDTLVTPHSQHPPGPPFGFPQLQSPQVVEPSAQYDVRSFTGQPPYLTSPSPLLPSSSSAGEEYLSSPLFSPEKDDLPGDPCHLEALNDEPTREEGVLPTLLFTIEANPPAPDMSTFPGARQTPSRRTKKRKPIGRLSPQPGPEAGLSSIVARNPLRSGTQKTKKKKKSATGSVQPPSPALLSPAAAAGPSRATDPALFVRGLEHSPQHVPVQMGPEDMPPEWSFSNTDGFGPMPGDWPACDPSWLPLLDWLNCLHGNPSMAEYPTSNGDIVSEPGCSQPPFSPSPYLWGSQESTDYGHYPAPSPSLASPEGPFAGVVQLQLPPAGSPDNLVDVAPPSSAPYLTPLGAIDAHDASPESVKQALICRIDELGRHPAATNTEADKLILKRCLETHSRMIASFASVPSQAVSSNAGGGKVRKKMRCFVPGCNQTLSSSQRLFTHLETHLKTKGVLCSECKPAMILAGDIDRHFRLVHRMCDKCRAPYTEDDNITHYARCTKRKRRCK